MNVLCKVPVQLNKASYAAGYITLNIHTEHTTSSSSLAWPDPFRAGAYRLEIISAALQGSGMVHRLKMNNSHLRLVSVN